MLVGMKLIASVAALVLTGLVAGWLWLDATADVRGDTVGVAITGTVDPAQMSGAALTVDGTAAEDGEPTTGDPSTATSTPDAAVTTASAEAVEDGLDAGVVSVLRASAGELVDRADKQVKADKKARADKKGQDKKAVQVQPAPVNPGGWCEWDDDDGWECDDYDDDWDDD